LQYIGGESVEEKCINKSHLKSYIVPSFSRNHQTGEATAECNRLSEIYIEEFLRVSKASMKAERLIGKTVVKVNEDILIDGAEALKSCQLPITFGVKNTDQISRRYIKALTDSKKYLWHTIDEMAEGGRAVDMNLLNPVTGKIMTGSSSATAINVLYGINQVGIGTDGGGSVLAPAMSLNLFSIMAKGMGLKGTSGRISTDNISFVPGVGIISQCYELAEESILVMLGLEKKEININKTRVLVCRKNNIMLPDGSDMRERLDRAVEKLKELGIEVGEEEFPLFGSREEVISWAKAVYDSYDVVLTCEGPVDIMGMGDSVFGELGDFAKSIQNKSGKYMVKIANMINATSITLPIEEAASGIVITAKEGLDNGFAAMAIARQLKELYRLPELYYRYFRDSYRRRRNDIIFSVKEV
jgi:hypothetical protein